MKMLLDSHIRIKSGDVAPTLMTKDNLSLVEVHSLEDVSATSGGDNKGNAREKRGGAKTAESAVNRELREIFKVDRKFSDRLASRESSSVEFKESFSFKAMAKYARTLAAFANCKGGMIVFGVKNNPHTYPGLQGRKLDAFLEVDPERVSRELNDYFSPELRYEKSTYEFKGNTFGYLYVYEAEEKPIIANKNQSESGITEGGVYYRYHGRTQNIRYPELRQIMDDVRAKEQVLWMRHILRVAKIGIRDVGIFNFKTGVTTANNGNMFLLDESVLSQVAFIKEGEFSEVKGKPTLKVIGNVEGICAGGLGTQIVRAHGIDASNIICDFLDGKQIRNGFDYVRQICFETTGNLPCYYYIYKSGKTISEVLEEAQKIVSRAQSKDQLLDRITRGTTSAKKFTHSGSAHAEKRRAYADALATGEISTLCINSIDDAIRFCEEIQSSSAATILPKDKAIRKVLKGLFAKYYEAMKGNASLTFRRAVCWVDEVLYKERCEGGIPNGRVEMK